jgi:uncharacterized protein (TIGR00290 family)
MGERAIVSWSGGKDSALALYELRGSYDVAALVTTVTEDYDRISMHGVRTELLRRQAAALGLPLDVVSIPARCSNAIYEERMRAALARWREQGVSAVICGDIFLEDVRRYREERLFTGTSLHGVFPLWGRPTRDLAARFLGAGFRAVLCCVDTRVCPLAWAGRAFDEALLADLPPGADPCAENGEFHTFVFDGPIFSEPVRFTLGEAVLRDERFGYRDLLPAGEGYAAGEKSAENAKNAGVK